MDKRVCVHEGVAFLMIFISVIIGFHFAMVQTASIVWPTLGLMLAFFVYPTHRYNTGTYVGIVVGYIVSYLFLSDHSITDAFMLGLSLSHVNVAMSAGTALIIKRITNDNILSLKLLWLFPLILVIYPPISAFFGMVISFQELSWYQTFYTVWWLGDLYSLLIFFPVLSLALRFDQTYQHHVKEEIIVTIIFTAFSFVFFMDAMTVVTYDFYKFFYFPFAFYVAYKLPYRSYLVFTFIYAVFMISMPPYQLGEVTIFFYLFDINTFLVVLMIVILTLKGLFIYIDLEAKKLALTSHRRNQLVESMEMLFTFSREQSTLDAEDDEKHVSDVFHLIFNLFDVFDYGTCMLIKNNTVHFVDGVGYDIDYLNGLSLDADKWDKNLKGPKLIKNPEALFKADYGDSYQAYHQRNPMLKQSLLFSLTLSHNITCEMSFDIGIESKETITNDMLKYFESLYSLFNSFYESNIMHQKNNRLKTSMVESLLTMIGLFDPRTQKHSEDVAKLAVKLGKALNLGDVIISELYWAGIVHDIGKIGVDKAVVNKQGVYTLDEYTAMQKHVIYGEQTLAKSSNLKKIASMVKHHHERHDGLGYPDQLKSDDILIETAIIGVAEAVATMARKQTFAPQKSAYDIITELKALSGSQFNPRVADAMVRLIEQGVLDSFYEDDKR